MWSFGFAGMVFTAFAGKATLLPCLFHGTIPCAALDSMRASPGFCRLEKGRNTGSWEGWPSSKGSFSRRRLLLESQLSTGSSTVSASRRRRQRWKFPGSSSGARTKSAAWTAAAAPLPSGSASGERTSLTVRESLRPSAARGGQGEHRCAFHPRGPPVH